MERFKYPVPVTTRRDSPNLGPAGQALLLVFLLLHQSRLLSPHTRALEMKACQLSRAPGSRPGPSWAASHLEHLEAGGSFPHRLSWASTLFRQPSPCLCRNISSSRRLWGLQVHLSPSSASRWKAPGAGGGSGTVAMSLARGLLSLRPPSPRDTAAVSRVGEAGVLGHRCREKRGPPSALA